MFVKNCIVSDDFLEQLQNLQPWSHYFKFDDVTYTGYIEDVFNETGRTFCCRSDSPQMIERFRRMYEDTFVNSRRFLMPIELLKTIAGNQFATSSVLDLSCNDGLKAIACKLAGAGYVNGVEIRRDCVERGKFISGLMGVDVAFNHVSASADSPEYGAVIEPADYVLSLGILYHLVDHEQYLKTLRTLTKKCMIMFTSHGGPQSRESDEKREIPYRSFTGKAKLPARNEVTSMLYKAGFEHVLEWNYNPSVAPTDFTESCLYLVAYP
ncbi:MAG: methyltransferase domain-containing protein [Alphaproteobacteria bacterium]|nr:methyltransferase domain-containing protein [Alphaproteobacteria bacterium]